MRFTIPLPSYLTYQTISQEFDGASSREELMYSLAAQPQRGYH
jgi:hypothetical protein